MVIFLYKFTYNALSDPDSVVYLSIPGIEKGRGAKNESVSIFYIVALYSKNLKRLLFYYNVVQNTKKANFQISCKKCKV